MHSKDFMFAYYVCVLALHIAAYLPVHSTLHFVQSAPYKAVCIHFSSADGIVDRLCSRSLTWKAGC